MQVYKVGADELSEYEWGAIQSEEYVWFAYDYTADSYEGWGMAVALRKDGQLQYNSLGHCSCYGPMENWPGAAPVTPEEFFRQKDSIHDIDWSPALKSKVKELLG